MKNIKTYITLGNRARLSVEVKVKGKYQRVEFSNGGLTAGGNAKFQTSDENLQNALESSKMYGEMFKLHGQKKLQEQTKEAPKGDDTKGQDEGEPMTFPNFNALRDYLVGEHECKSAEVKDLTTAIATAKKLGIKVSIE